MTMKINDWESLEQTEKQNSNIREIIRFFLDFNPNLFQHSVPLAVCLKFSSDETQLLLPIRTRTCLRAKILFAHSITCKYHQAMVHILSGTLGYTGTETLFSR